jgi:hypothetical protein
LWTSFDDSRWTALLDDLNRDRHWLSIERSFHNNVDLAVDPRDCVAQHL